MASRIDDDTSRIRAHQQKIRDEERETQKRIQEARKQAEEARLQGDREVTQIRDEYVSQSENLKTSNEASLQDEQAKAYEQMIKVKRQQEAEVHRMRRQGEKSKADLDQYYRYTTMEADTKGKQELGRLMKTNETMAQYQTRMAQEERLLEDKTYQGQMTQLRDEHESTAVKLKQEQRQQYEQIKGTYAKANEEAHAKYEGNYQNTVKTHNDTLGQINKTAAELLNSLRADTTDKLAAYSSRQNDPFYRLVDTRGRLEDKGDWYQLKAQIPVHEQDTVNVSVRGNQVVLAGTRRSNDQHEVAPGQVRHTSAFQSYNETFPIDMPVEPKAISKEFDGDTLTVRIPKKKFGGREISRAAGKNRAQPDTLKAERPDFPKNLPLYSTGKKDDDAEA